MLLNGNRNWNIPVYECLIRLNYHSHYWAARLNQDNILTIYPKKWYNSKYAVPDIFPSEWVGV